MQYVILILCALIALVFLIEDYIIKNPRNRTYVMNEEDAEKYNRIFITVRYLVDRGHTPEEIIEYLEKYPKKRTSKPNNHEKGN